MLIRSLEVTDLAAHSPFDGFSVQVLAEGVGRSAFLCAPCNTCPFQRRRRFCFIGVDADSGTALKSEAVSESITGSFSMNLRAFRNLNIYAW